MKEITTGNGRFMFVPILTEATKVELFMNNLIWSNEDTAHAGHNITLPSGSYTLLFTTDNVTEEHAREVVDKAYGLILGNHIGFIDYSDDYSFYHDATDSFHSLKHIHSLTAPRYAVLKIN